MWKFRIFAVWKVMFRCPPTFALHRPRAEDINFLLLSQRPYLMHTLSVGISIHIILCISHYRMQNILLISNATAPELTHECIDTFHHCLHNINTSQNLFVSFWRLILVQSWIVPFCCMNDALLLLKRGFVLPEIRGTSFYHLQNKSVAKTNPIFFC